jgi:hypothetical protein
MEYAERKKQIEELRFQIIAIRRKQLDQHFSPERFEIYKESNKHLLWLKEHGMLKSKYIRSFLKIPKDLLEYIEKYK